MEGEKQLSIRSTEAADLAEALSAKLGGTKKDAVLLGLRLLAEREAQTLSEKKRLQQAWIERVIESAKRLREAAPPGLSSDHRWMYDDRGLPK